MLHLIYDQPLELNLSTAQHSTTQQGPQQQPAGCPVLFSYFQALIRVAPQVQPLPDSVQKHRHGDFARQDACSRARLIALCVASRWDSASPGTQKRYWQVKFLLCI